MDVNVSVNSLGPSAALSIRSGEKRKRDSSLGTELKEYDHKKRRVEPSFLERIKSFADCIFLKPSAICFSVYKSLSEARFFRHYGKIVLRDRSVYKGEIRNGVPHGYGELVKLDKSSYQGEFVEGKLHGSGTFKMPYVVEYEGQFQNGCFHGVGIATYPDGSKYEGEFREDLYYGYGKRTCADGAIYRGYLVDGFPHGKGETVDAEGNCHQGDWVNGVMCGTGKFIDGTKKYQCEGIWKNDRIISSIINLSDGLFFDLLCGPHKTTPPNGYCLGIVQDYLEKKGYTELANPLKEAQRYSFFNKEEAKKESYIICSDLKSRNEFKLICYGFDGHDMGLKLVSDVSAGFIFCKIFNTGEGIEKYHKKHPSNPKKYQLRLQVKVPIESFTPKVIKALLLSRDQSLSANEAYGHILNLRGAPRRFI